MNAPPASGIGTEAMEEASAVRPPALPFVFSVGVTGHRGAALAGAEEEVRRRLAMLLGRLAELATAIRKSEPAAFSDAPPKLRLISPLADGADQIAAEVALELGYELHAVLPFAEPEYRRDFEEPGQADRFDSLLGQAAGVLELPGVRDEALEAYVMAGRATLAHCDLLLAVWDGLPPRGRGGTGEVVDLALHRGKPTIRVPVDPDESIDLRWSGYDAAVFTRSSDSATVRPFDEAELEQLVKRLLAPPEHPSERSFIHLYHHESRRRYRLRIEYPLLLTATGVGRLRNGHWRNDVGIAYSRADWARYRQACDEARTVSAPLGKLQHWYEWPDSLASHFAQSFRSGHVFNFLLGAVAVLLALTGLIAPAAKQWLVAGEFAVILAILVNTQFAVSRQWQRRWLDYRQLAERLRPMRALKLVGLAAPDPPGSLTRPVATRWIEWYSAAAWRAAGCPSGRIATDDVRRLAEMIATYEIQPQIDYHRSTALQGEKLDRRLELAGLGLFGATLFACLAMLVSVTIDSHWVKEHLGWWTLIMAGLPAIGTAVFGIRVQGDYGGSAARSEQTAEALEEIVGHLTSGPARLGRVADLVEQAARSMLLELDDWRLLSQQHELSV